MSGRYPDDPVTHPVAFHTWEALTFVHFAYDVAAVQRLVPDRLTVQEWEGATWVGITPFRMADVRAPFLPPPPGWGAFAELNVRCYVRGPDGRDGIWFLGMVVPRLGFLAALRSLGLPYQLSDCELRTQDGARSYRFGTPGLLTRAADEWFTAQVHVALADRPRAHPARGMRHRALVGIPSTRATTLAHPCRARAVATARRDGHGSAHRTAALGRAAGTGRGTDGARRSARPRPSRLPAPRDLSVARPASESRQATLDAAGGPRPLLDRQGNGRDGGHRVVDA